MAPTRRRISRLDAGMIGDSSTAARRIASAASNSTCVKRSACDCSFASAHGAVSAMWTFAASISRKTAAPAFVMSSSPIARRKFVMTSFATSRNRSELAAAGTSRPCRYWCAIAVTRLTRLPRLFARSALYLSSNRSNEKSPSSPNTTP